MAALLGARVEQFYALDTDVPVAGDWGSGKDTIWADQLTVTSPETQVLMRYGKSNGWLDGQPAVVTRKLGRGSITYIGASLDETTMKAAAKWMMLEAGLPTLMPELPSTLDVAVRSGAGKRVLILTNYGVEPFTVRLPTAMKDSLAGGSVTSVTLPRYAVAVLE